MLDAPRIGRDDAHSYSGSVFTRGSVQADWPVYEFGPFVASSRTRSLLKDGSPVPLGGRAFKILLMLLGSPGTAFSKEQILQNVWPSVIVGEGNVKVQISYLRKALGDLSEDIVCVSGDGYVFTGDVVVQ